MPIPRESALGRVRLTHEEAVLLSYLLSKEVIEYRGSKYDGVQMYVQSCRDVRQKVKRVVIRYQEVSGTHATAPSLRDEVQG